MDVDYTMIGINTNERYQIDKGVIFMTDLNSSFTLKIENTVKCRV